MSSKAKPLGSDALRAGIDTAIMRASYKGTNCEPLGYREGVPNAGFLSNVSGEEPYKLQNQLERLGFTHFAMHAPYYWHCRNIKAGVVVQYVEGDVYIYDRIEFDNAQRNKK
jgi:hypothetical protein